MDEKAANFIAPRVKCTATNERQLSGSQSETVSDGSWPIATVEFTDVANHVNCPTGQLSRSAAA